MRALLFLLSFLRHPWDIASLVPTSRSAARSVVDLIDPTAKVIVEYGPGTGVVTRELLASKKFGQDTRFILIEKTPELAAHLLRTVHDPRVRIYQGSAENVKLLLHACGFKQVDCIISSIPLSVMPEETRQTILRETANVLVPGGQFITFLVRQSNQAYIAHAFPHITMQREWRNIPPLFLFSARAPRQKDAAIKNKK